MIFFNLWYARAYLQTYLSSFKMIYLHWTSKKPLKPKTEKQPCEHTGRLASGVQPSERNAEKKRADMSLWKWQAEWRNCATHKEARNIDDVKRELSRLFLSMLILENVWMSELQVPFFFYPALLIGNWEAHTVPTAEATFLNYWGSESSLSVCCY